MPEGKKRLGFWADEKPVDSPIKVASLDPDVFLRQLEEARKEQLTPGSLRREADQAIIDTLMMIARQAIREGRSMPIERQQDKETSGILLPDPKKPIKNL